MPKPVLLFALGLLANSAMAQQSPVASPPTGQPDSHAIPGASSDRTTVTVAPDPAATPMADPQSTAEFGSPSAVESPSSPMPNPSSWPAIRPSAKRPAWVKKAPPKAQPGKVSPPAH